MRKIYEIPRVDGGVMTMTTADADVDPVEEIKKWTPEMQALVDVGRIKMINVVLPTRIRKKPF